MFRNLPPVTRNLIIINTIVLILMKFDSSGIVISNFALYGLETGYFKIWQPFTYMYLHGGFGHLFFNMFTLYFFGCALENVWGGKKFFIYYTICGIGAALCNILLVHTGYATVGASGAIYGILVSYAMLYPDSIMTLLFPPISLKAKWFVCIFAGIEILTGIFATNSGIAHFAHLGGMVTGALIILLLKKRHTMYDRGW